MMWNLWQGEHRIQVEAENMDEAFRKARATGVYYQAAQPAERMTPYERTKAAVYATGNKWVIENFNATH